jgi:glycosyltransferase involved in cell wall biosynthesis
MPYSTLILTRNEADNIERCLDSLSHCDDVVVLDSLSTDDTCNRAERFGARVVQRAFDSFAGQRNWAIDNVSFRHPWVLHLDADECLTPELHAEIESVTQKDTVSAYLLANKLMFMGRWIRRASMYPFFQARLLKLGEARFTQHGHGQVLAYAERGVGKLREPYIHYNFSRGITDWVERHNRYSTHEAYRIATTGQGFVAGAMDAVGGVTREARQQGLKRAADALPFRPLIRFLYLYLVRGAFLDGRAGLDYSVLMAFYDYLTRIKVRELHQTETKAQSRNQA